MKEYAKIENNEVKYVYDLSPNFEGVTAKQVKAFDAIKRMYFKLMSEYEGEPTSNKENSSKENLQISRHPSDEHSLASSPQVEPLGNIKPENSNEKLLPSRGSTYRVVTSPQQMAQILTFINLPAQQAEPALNAVVNNAAAQSMTLVQRNSLTGDILSSHFGDRFSKASTGGEVARSAGGVTESVVTPDSKTQPSSQANSKNTPFSITAKDGGMQASDRMSASRKGGCPQSGQGDFLTSDNSNILPENKNSSSSVTTPTCQRQATSPQGEALENSAWFKFVYNKGEMCDGTQYRGRSGIIGYDLKVTDTKSFGLFFGHGNNTIDGFDDAWAKNKIEENKFGIYASRKNDKASGFLYFDYGKVDNELNRNLINLDLSTNVKYKGDLYEIIIG